MSRGVKQLGVGPGYEWTEFFGPIMSRTNPDQPGLLDRTRLVGFGPVGPGLSRPTLFGFVSYFELFLLFLAQVNVKNLKKKITHKIK